MVLLFLLKRLSSGTRNEINCSLFYFLKVCLLFYSLSNVYLHLLQLKKKGGNKKDYILDSYTIKWPIKPAEMFIA